MGNRNIQQKMLKMKRRNRFARFSGATSKFHTSDVALVGEVSLTNQVINTGRGPNAERMQEYYARVNSYDEALPELIEGSMPLDLQRSIHGRRTESGLRLKDFDLGAQYADFIKGFPREMRIRLVDDAMGKLDLYFGGTQWFFVEVDLRKKYIRRSRIYSNKRMAYAVLEAKCITWVEQLPTRSAAAAKP